MSDVGCLTLEKCGSAALAALHREAVPALSSDVRRQTSDPSLQRRLPEFQYELPRQRPMHIMRYLPRYPLRPLGLVTGKVLIHGFMEVSEPLIKVRTAQLALVMELAMDIHGMAFIVIFAEEELFPIGLNAGEVFADIDLGHIEKDRRQALVDQQFVVESFDELANAFRAVEIRVGHGG